MDNIVNYVLVLLIIVIWVGIAIRILRNYFSKTKIVYAIVVDKQCYDKQIYSKGQAPYIKKEYVITFLCGGRKINFNVSELSYNNYRIKEKGKLVYKGNRIIDFAE